MRTTHVLPFALAALSSLASAQGPYNLVGITRTGPFLVQQDSATCAFENRCNVPLPGATQRWAGGTAYDASRGGVWVSNGAQLMLLGAEDCAVLCPPSTFPGVAASEVLTGLAMNESTGVLFALTSQGRLIRAHNTCPPTFIDACNTGLSPTNSAATSGLAVDEALGLLFFSYSDFATHQSRIAYSTLLAPCQLLGSRAVGPCSPATPYNAVTGLAVDWCQSILYLTDGHRVQGWQYTYNPFTQAISYTVSQCCSGPSVLGDPMVGLCVRPPLARSVGQSCRSGLCPPCPMDHRTITDPTVGNPNLRLGLENAPGQSFAWLIIGGGPCAPAPTIFPLCGPILAGGGAPPVLTLGPQLTGTGLGCSGSADWTLQVPMSSVFCGTVWSSQVAVLCPSAILPGTSLSNCLTWRLTGS